MAASVAEDAPEQGAAGPNHGLRIFIIWLPLAVAADILLYFVYGPHMPPGRMSNSAASQQFDIKVHVRAGGASHGLRACLHGLLDDRVAAPRG